ncbi:MAG TPA: hypothetical protein VFA40_08160 [Terriglobales bacterium]|jgi:hypothetical protein|nr:hypothetical protein [Terriglobales bacterium]
MTLRLAVLSIKYLVLAEGFSLIPQFLKRDELLQSRRYPKQRSLASDERTGNHAGQVH